MNWQACTFFVLNLLPLVCLLIRTVDESKKMNGVNSLVIYLVLSMVTVINCV